MKRGAVLILSLLACSSVPAFAQSNSELAGAPGWREAEEQAERAAARRQVEDQIAEARARSRKQAEQAASARSAAARKADQERIAKQADASRRSREDDLKAREAQLAAREKALAAEEERLAQQRAEADGAEADHAETQHAETGDEHAEASAGPGPLLDRPLLESAAPEWRGRDSRSPEWRALDEGPPLRLHASIRSCAFAGEDKALARDYVSARYVRAPRFFERSAHGGAWELRGVMRVEDWRGHVIADTVCELDGEGRVQRFAFLR